MFKAFVPKITLPAGRSDIRKGGGIGIICNGQTMLFDGFEGGEPTNGMKAWLAENGVSTVDVAVLSHIHYDHYNGLLQIEDDSRFHIKQVLMYDPLTLQHGCDGSANGRAVKDDMNNAYKFIRAMQANGTKVNWIDKGGTVRCGDTSWKVYRNQPKEFTDLDDGNAYAFVNDGSLVLWSPETHLMFGGDGCQYLKYAISYFNATISGFYVQHHGNDCPLSDAQAAKNAGAVVAWETNVERDGAGTTDFTQYGARRVKQVGIPVWMQNENIYITAEHGRITFRQGSKTVSKSIPYQGVSEGWGKDSKGWFYVKDGKRLTGWHKIKWSKGNDWFLFSPEGVMLTGWQQAEWSGGKNWFYLNPNTGAMQTGWIFVDGSWYYLDPDTGAMKTGWLKWKDRWCYLEPTAGKNQGHCYVNFVATIDGKTYRFDKDGYAEEVQTGNVSQGAKVIDVSEFQPENIDWNKVKAEGYAVIIRIGLRGSIPGTERYRKVDYDKHFKKYLNGVIAAGIPYSVYFFPTPLSDAEADQEADWIIMNVAGLNLSMPLWLDSEKVRDGVANDISTAERTRYLKRITDKLISAGIPCGIYASTSWLNNQINMSAFPRQVRDNTWCAQYASSCTYGGAYAMWQYSSKARVDGINDEIDISIVNRAFNMSCKKTASKSDAMAKDNVKIFPTTNPVKISNSGSDEHGNYKGGTAGDNTGKEWYIRDWYNRPWNCVLRHPDPEVRACLADLATKAANNNRIGYDQYQRQTYWNELQKVNYDPSKITVACEADCSAGVIANVKAAGHLLGREELQGITCTYTGNMRSGLKAAGFACLTESKYLTGSSYLVAGDILLNDAHHTATAVTNGVNSGNGSISPAFMPLIKRGSTGSAVLQLQKLLNKLGYKLEEDGSFGPATDAAVRSYQKAHGLEVDGEVGKKTWGALFK